MLAFLLATVLLGSDVPVSGLVAKLRRRYPAFRNVDADDIDYWLSDARRIVTVAWGTDEEPATLALAAHNMRKAGVAGIATSGESLGAGVTSFRSGAVSISVTEVEANRAGDAGYGSTLEGAEFAVMLRRNSGGPFLAGYVEPRGLCW